LRKEYNFPRDPKKKFGVDCVFSQEPIRQPSRATSADFCEAPVDGAAGLACAGYGSSVAVTACFGFAAAARVLDTLLGPMDPAK
jgi:tRNA A37 threonylcarbamoyladenosine dehydratase